MMKQIRQNRQKYYHLVGIKGTGMSALAQILKTQGHKVTGSDSSEVFITDSVLKRAQIPVFSPFSEKNLKNPDVVVRSQAYGEDNPEIKKAKEKAIKILTYPQALGELVRKKIGIAVSGTHGKTTITVLSGLLLNEAGLDSTVICGSLVDQFGFSNARIGKSKYFVLEACEFKESFLAYEPKIILLSTIDYDHTDYYPDFQSYKKAFLKFVKKLPQDGFLIACFDDENVKEVALKSKKKVISYGLSGDFDIKGEKIKTTTFRTTFEVSAFSKNLGIFKILLPGFFNVQNALAIIALGLHLKIPLVIIKKVLSEYKGIKRRFETLGIVRGIRVMDDFAHHPTEIKLTLKAVRQFYPKARIWAVFQPYTYSRTKSLLSDFSKSFCEADFVVLDEIYGSAREKNRGEIKGEDLYNLTKKYHKNVYFVPGRENIANFLVQKVKTGDVVITMSCGDIYKAGQRLLEKLRTLTT